ncbi:MULTISPECIES: ATP-binding protein [Sphingobium]|jgi:signal transduction histidine kinase|uniref:histidine kinase n=1 Tax=Sphingobium soli TaxID=1591116 RepID=A0ABS8GYQ9_9SPHN|nr:MULTISPECIES: ATP-binding protein [Sphingobium]MEE2742025.1 ATP-binding protein [Pseudomonadota bacterium]MBS48000.1 two-component sensor histidine kinase [Sphingobium sp.]MCC4231349.1 HAMP domain-containing protein [Sphingobium soli]MCC4255526.1 HAMP domain-containing protein [Sphingobium lactosutens]HCW60485.1 two-component sensor histidine kinase [Sphingobium sp.]|tara:strand:- start:150 stop:1469 length:1320 start_codon:yes stop_codon:yes gene_type:complete
MRGSLGLLGRLFAILLLTVLLEFAVGTLIYERTSQLYLQDDEARRLAEHLVIARKLLTEQPPEDRRLLGIQLTTDRYDVHWSPAAPPPPPLSPELERMRRQIIAWEPSLERSQLWLRLTPGRHSEINGGLRLADGSWLYFGMPHGGGKWAFTIGRMGLALIPVLALLLAGWVLIRRTLAPLRDLTHATHRIGLGSEVIVPEAGTADVRNLISAFNAMQARMHRLINERTETLAAVGHDLRTPLARLQLRLEGVRDDETRDAMADDLEEMGAMLESLLAFLGGEKDPEPVVRTDIAVSIATVVDAFQDHGQDVSYDGPDHLEMEVRGLSLRRAVRNLVENALHYGDRARVSLLRKGQEVLIRVDDDGPGIPRERLEEVLRPFSRLDDARQRNTRGLGLGLAIVQKAVAVEGGHLTLANRPDGGLRAEICLHLPRSTARGG